MSAQVSRVAASVPPLMDADYSTMLASLNRALAVSLSASSVAESRSLPSIARTLEEHFAYAELAMRRVVRALREMPDFRGLPLDHQMAILKVRVSISDLRTAYMRCLAQQEFCSNRIFSELFTHLLFKILLFAKRKIPYFTIVNR